MKCNKIIALVLGFSAFGFGLEFGTMGGVSSGIGGAGVAVKNSAWGIYYNPALLGADNRAKLGFSFGVQVKEQNLLNLASLDFDSFKDLSSILQKKLLDKNSSSNTTNGGNSSSATTTVRTLALATTTASASPSATTSTSSNGSGVKFDNTQIDGVFGDVLMNLFNKKPGDTIDKEAVEKLAKEVGCSECSNSSGSSGTSDLKSIAQKLEEKAKSDPSIQSKLKDKVSNAANATGNSLIAGIVSGLTGASISSILKKASEGSLSAEDILSAAGTITIPRGTDSEVDKILDAIIALNKAINANDVYVATQNGIVFQFPGSKPKKRVKIEDKEVEIIERKSGRGAFALAIMPQAFMSGSVIADSGKRNIVIGIGKVAGTNSTSGTASAGSGNCDSLNPTESNCDFFKVGVSPTGVTLSKGQKTDFDNSILATGANHQIQALALNINEIPVAYGHTLFSPIGDINIGVTGKFIFAFGYDYEQKITITNGKMSDISAPSIDVDVSSPERFMESTRESGIINTQAWGVDVGALYSPSFVKNLHIGIVAKNLNKPKIATTRRNIELNTQVRVGASYEMSKAVTLAFDMDLLPNNTLSYNSPLSQVIGGGVMADLKIIDVKLGAMKDLRSNFGEGIILTGGINAFGIDVSVQYGLGQNVMLYGYAVPNYLALRVGGQWSF